VVTVRHAPSVRRLRLRSTRRLFRCFFHAFSSKRRRRKYRRPAEAVIARVPFYLFYCISSRARGTALNDVIRSPKRGGCGPEKLRPAILGYARAQRTSRELYYIICVRRSLYATRVRVYVYGHPRRCVCVCVCVRVLKRAHEHPPPPSHVCTYVYVIYVVCCKGDDTAINGRRG